MCGADGQEGGRFVFCRGVMFQGSPGQPILAMFQPCERWTGVGLGGEATFVFWMRPTLHRTSGGIPVSLCRPACYFSIK